MQKHSDGGREKQLRNFADRLIAIEHPRTFYLSIPKCGCTYVKNVLWFMREGRYHVNPIRVHDDERKFLRGHQLCSSDTDLAKEPRAFTVLRRPTDRFLSLYLDKIIGSGRVDFVPLADALLKTGGFREQPSSVDEHRRNLEILIDWLDANISEGVDLPRNPHWTPQSNRLGVIRSFDLKILVVDKLTIGLHSVFNGVECAEIALQSAERNRSSRSLLKAEYLSPAIRRKVNALYATDRELFTVANSFWQKCNRSASLNEAPRFSELFGGSRVFL